MADLAPAAVEFRAVVEEAARSLVKTIHRSGETYVRLPLLYPSGANVVVRVDGGPNTFFVSDFGAGYTEAEMLGAPSLFTRHARAIADRAGVGFDEHAFFVMTANKNQLAGTIASVGNCSQEAVRTTVLKMSEREAAADSQMLIERLVNVFGQKPVTPRAKVLGASSTQWRVAAIVKVGKKPAIFDAVASQHTSVFAASAKFHDIALIEQAPIRIAMVKKKADLGTYLGVLAQAANVVEQDISDTVLHRLAEAA